MTHRSSFLEPTASSDVVRKNINARCSARKNFTTTENSEKIRRALRHQVRTYVDDEYDNGDKVYFKRKDF